MKARIRRDDYGFPAAVSIGDWDIVHLNNDGRTTYCCELLVDILNQLPKKALRRLLDAAKKEADLPSDQSRLKLVPPKDWSRRERSQLFWRIDLIDRLHSQGRKPLNILNH
jgi:hypothetical protein